MTAEPNRINLGAALAGALALFGCQESVTTPSVPPVPPDKVIPIYLGGVFVQPGATIRIFEGTRVTIHAATDGPGRDFTGGGRTPGIPVRARHDAPPDQVTAGGDVRVEGTTTPGLVHIRALADDVEEPDATYSLWLEEIPETRLGGGFVLEVDPTPLRFTVVDRTTARCGDAGIRARARAATGAAGEFAVAIFGDEVQEYRVADLTVEVADPNLEVSLLTPYRTPFEHLEDDDANSRYTALPMGFVLDTRLAEIGDSLQQTLTLAHFEPLRLVAESPGCRPIEVECETTGCSIHQENQ